MARRPDKRGLGRGLSALLGDAEADLSASVDGAPPAVGAATSRIPIEHIRPNPAQPRRTFREQDLDELAQSLRTHGVIQPVLLRPDPDHNGQYQIVAGERRWRAAQRAGVHELPAVIHAYDDREALGIAIVENVQRVDLDPLEEAQGYAQLIDSFGYTQEELAGEVGKSRSHVANTLRLLGLPQEVRDLASQGKLSAGHARALLTAPDPVALARRAVAEALTVRQVEALAKKPPAAGAKQSTSPKPEKDADTRMLEADLTAAIGMRVQIEHGPEGSGQMRIRYKSLEHLDQLCRKLTD